MKKLSSILVLLLISIAGFSQLEMSVGTIKTTTNNTAVDFVLKFAAPLDSIFNSQDLTRYGKNSVFNIVPRVNIQYGTNDAFNSINMQAVGLYSIFRMERDSEGIIAPNLDKTFHTFPFALGVESDNTFKRINGVAEFGYVPWYQSETNSLPDFIKRTKFGVFVQGGRKFYQDTTATATIGRVRGNFNVDTRRLITVSGISLGLVGDADYWYDFVNGKTYYKIEGIARVFLSDAVFTDFKIQEGSGAPNFFQGTQYGLALTFKL